MTTHHELEIEGHKLVALGFHEQRSGPTAIFLHGIASSPAFWIAGQTPVFDQRFRWYALSLPGHYPAALPAGFRRADLTAETLARVLAEAVRRLAGGAPALLVGHSTGGFAALAIAAVAPELVRSVISVSGFVQGRWGGPLGALQWLARRGPPGEVLLAANFRLMGSSLALYRAAVRLYTADARAFFAFDATDSTFRATLPDLQRLDTRAMAHYFARMPDIDISGWLPRIQAPVLALTGDRDPIVPPAQARLIADGVPEGRLALLPGAGHIPMAERAGDYSRLVTAWAEQTVP